MGDKKKIDMCEQGVNNLRLAITKQAVKDYKDAIRQKNSGAQRSMRNFFSSEYGKMITGGVSADAVERSLRVQVKYDEWRREKKCNKCKKKDCVHRSGEHYTELERGDIYCEKELQDKTDKEVLQEA